MNIIKGSLKGKITKPNVVSTQLPVPPPATPDEKELALIIWALITQRSCLNKEIDVLMNGQE